MNLVIYISIILSCIISYAVTLWVLKYAHKKKIYDYQNSRKIHKGNIPRLGGVAISSATIISLSLICVASFLMEGTFLYIYFSSHLKLMLLSVLALAIIIATGFYDDIKGFRYRTKFAAQITAGLIMCASGYWINNFHGLFGLYDLNIYEGWVLTIFTVVLISNAINFIDGIDGLAGTMCLFIFTFYLVVGVHCSQMAIVLTSSTIIGALLPFLYFNVFGNAESKKKIFMGDTGALFMGFIISVICVDITNHKDLIFHSSPFAVAYCPLVVPCFDLARVVINRLYESRSPFKADKTHLHHIILSIVQSQRITLLYIITLTIFITTTCIILTFKFNINLVFLFVVVIWLILMMLLYRKLNKLRNTNKQ